MTTTLKLYHSSYPSRFRFSSSASSLHPLLLRVNTEYCFVKAAKSFGISAVLASSDDRPKWLKLFGISPPSPPPPPPPPPTAYQKFCAFVDDVLKESKQILQVSMRKQLINNVQFVDVLALGIYVLVKEHKSKENSKPKSTAKDSIKGHKSRQDSKPTQTGKGMSFNASAGLKHFRESVLEELSDVFGASLKKQLVKTLIVLDLVAILQIAEVCPAYTELLERFGPILSVLWFVLRLCAYTFIKLSKEKTKE